MGFVTFGPWSMASAGCKLEIGEASLIFSPRVIESSQVLQELDWPVELVEVEVGAGGVERLVARTPLEPWVVILVFAHGELSGHWLGTCEIAEQ